MSDTLVCLGGGTWVNFALLTHVDRVTLDTAKGTYGFRLTFGAGLDTTDRLISLPGQVEALEAALRHREHRYTA
jgi:hypothetical protein